MGGLGTVSGVFVWYVSLYIDMFSDDFEIIDIVF